MKTIIVLTDFSKMAQSAANAAVNMAPALHSNILLVNSYMLPFAVFAMEAEGRSLVDSGHIASVSETGLKKEARRLRRLIDLSADASFKPRVDYHSTIDSLNHTIKALNKSISIALVVMGVHHTTIPLFFSAIDLESLLGTLNVPLLIIPKKHKGFLIKHVVLATDLDSKDLSILNKISSYAKAFRFHIHVCHVSEPVFVPDFIEEDKVRQFEHHVSMLGKENITFTNLKGNNIAKTLSVFSHSISADVLGIIYHPHSFSWKLFHKGHFSSLIKNQPMPLFIFPPHLLNSNNGHA